MTFDVFNDPEPSTKEDAAVEPELDEEGNPIVKEKVVEEKLPQHLYVKEVVRDPRIFYYKVPRLGSYMAIRLEYQSCLFEEAFDAGVHDLIGVNEKMRIQNDEKDAYNKHQDELREQM